MYIYIYIHTYIYIYVCVCVIIKPLFIWGWRKLKACSNRGCMLIFIHAFTHVFNNV